MKLQEIDQEDSRSSTVAALQRLIGISRALARS